MAHLASHSDFGGVWIASRILSSAYTKATLYHLMRLPHLLQSQSSHPLRQILPIRLTNLQCQHRGQNSQQNDPHLPPDCRRPIRRRKPMKMGPTLRMGLPLTPALLLRMLMKKKPAKTTARLQHPRKKLRSSQKGGKLLSLMQRT